MRALAQIYSETGEKGLLSKRVLIVGNSEYCVKVASEAASIGAPITLISSRALVTQGMETEGRIEFFSPAALLEFQGTPGRFRAILGFDDGTRLYRDIGCVIVALESEGRADFAYWGIESNDNIISLVDLEQRLQGGSIDLQAGSRVCFISGFNHCSHPVSQRRVVRAAKYLREKVGLDVFVIMEHFKVAEDNLERLMREARDSGVVFVKLTNQSPQLAIKNGRVFLSYYDEGLGAGVEMGADMIVLEEGIYPPDIAPYISRTLGIHLDNAGFLQGDFIHNPPIYTNRNGIFVVGSCKGPMGKDRALCEAKAVALEVERLFKQFDGGDEKATINWDSDRCAACLTCYRVCPHKAINFSDGKTVFYPLACRSCGICMAVCPMNAIELIENYEQRTVIESDFGLDLEYPLPQLVIFACQNSAYETYELAERKGLFLHSDFKVIKVPCAGSIDREALTWAFAYGAKVVVVAACHHDSCKSIEGSHFGEVRSRMVNEMLEDMGTGQEYLIFGTVAPGMVSEFTEMIRSAEEKIRMDSPI